ncbi:hypothetical protein CDAR_547071 [Caerostris darwini]|uniref:Uncharacterized protein n=1 Tax=Caerostris darwini TaxID=1538125 RepID=A0AAV4U132_9ARAC|nr:hypothetical protein CDAR_547071 [Caerostris darwini]
MNSNYGQPASRSALMSAKYQFFSQTIGTMGMLVDKHLAQILKKMSENVSLIYSNMGVINNNAGNHGGSSLTDKILQIVKNIHPFCILQISLTRTTSTK